VHGGVAIEAFDQRQQDWLRRIRRQAMLEGGHTYLMGLTGLVAHIDLAGGIFAHQDDGKARSDAVSLP